MLIYLIFIVFLILFFLKAEKGSFCSTVLKSILVFFILIVFITEIFSIFSILNKYFIIGFWSFLFLFLFSFFLKNKLKIKILLNNFLYNVRKIKKAELILVIIILTLLTALFFQGIIYPPNNWDSLTYHLSRIMYWLGNENLNHFPTHILRHLYQPPFAEYIIMHVNVLQGNDYFSNSVQLLFLVFCLFPLNELLNLFNVSKTAKLTSFLYCVTIPSVLLQATTTKNDIVCAFFILTSILFLYKCYKEATLSNYLFLGISIGLGMLTKGTFYLFIFPALLIFLFFIVKQLFYEKKLKPILNGSLSVFMLLIINLGHFSRNYSINNNILSIDDVENKMYSNEEMNVVFFNSNLLKNIGLHMGYPLNDLYDNLIVNFHEKNDISIDEPKLNFLGTKYNNKNTIETQEDLVPNTFHFLIILIASISIIISSFFKKKYKDLIPLVIVVLQVIVFVVYLKWQPWHTRLHIPIFILSSIFIGIFFNNIKMPKLISYLITLLFVGNFAFYYVFNNTRPIITNIKYTKKINLKDSRHKKYFANQLYLYPEYCSIQKKMDETIIKKIGLDLNDWEYPLFSSYYYDKLKLVSINVRNSTNKIKQDINNIDVIISNKNNGNEYIFNGKTYINKTPVNKHIWIYK